MASLTTCKVYALVLVLGIAAALVKIARSLGTVGFFSKTIGGGQKG